MLYNSPRNFQINTQNFFQNNHDFLCNFKNYSKDGDSSTTASRESTNACYDANSGDGDTTTGSTKINSNRQHQILWNLFAHNLDSVIMSAIESQDFKMWYVD